MLAFFVLFCTLITNSLNCLGFLLHLVHEGAAKIMWYASLTDQDDESWLTIRGGVEDTRLEAKAKDTKKSEAKDTKNPRPRTAFPRTDILEAKGRNARGQGHKRKCSPKKKKRSSQKFFKRSPQKNVFQKIFQALHEILTIQKIVLKPRTGQFLRTWGLEAKAKDFKMCPRGQGRRRGLHLC